MTRKDCETLCGKKGRAKSRREGHATAARGRLLAAQRSRRATLLLIGWRTLFSTASKRTSKINVLLVSYSPDIEELAETINRYPQLGYRLAGRVRESGANVMKMLAEQEIDIVVAPKESQSDPELVHAIYEALHRGIRFIDASAFYEKILGKIPVDLISKVWFLQEISFGQPQQVEFLITILMLQNIKHSARQKDYLERTSMLLQLILTVKYGLAVQMV